MPLVDVPDLGVVEFPDDMSEDDISQAISKHLQPSQPSGEMPQVPKLGPESTLGDVLRQPQVIHSPPLGLLSPDDLRPGVRLIGGEVIEGKLGDTHPDIIKREGISADDMDMRGFVGPQGEFYDREGGRDVANLPTDLEQGRAHSPDLMKAQAPPWSDKPTLLAQLPETMFGWSEEGMERAVDIQKAREETTPEERRTRMAEIDQEYRKRGRMLAAMTATDPAKANQLGTQLERWKSEELSKIGVESVALFGRPKLGEPMTKQMEQDLFGPGLTGKTIGAAQRQAQGLAEALIQPEALPMAPGVAVAERALLSRAIRKGAVDVGKMDLMKEMPMTAVGHFTGQSFIPGMVTGAAEQLGQAAGHFWAGDIEAGTESAAGGLTATLMVAMPIHAARRGFAEAKSRRLEEERPVQDQLNEVEESLFQTEEADPARIDLMAKRADLQQRLDIRENWEEQVKAAAEGTGRPITITDYSLGPGNIAKPDGKGGIIVNREVLHKLLEIDAGGDPNLVSKVIKSLVNQEVIHASVPKADAEAYWNSLTDVERAIEESLYPFDRNAPAHIKGQEAIRRRIEMANGETPLEYLVKTSKGPMSSRSLDALERAFNATRKVLNRTGKDAEVISEQLEMVRRAENRIKQARKGAKDALVPETAPVLRPMREAPGKVAEKVPVKEAVAEDDARRRAEVLPVEQAPLTPEQDARARSIWEGATDQGRRRLRGDPTALLWEQLDPYEKLKIAKRAGVVKEAPPAAPTVEGPPAAPAEVTAVAGVTAPAGPAIGIKAPEPTKSREEIMAGLRHKEEVARQSGSDYVGTFRDKSGNLMDEYDVSVREEGGTRTITVNVPDGAGPDAVRKAIAERMRPEEPFARRKAPTESVERFLGVVTDPTYEMRSNKEALEAGMNSRSIGDLEAILDALKETRKKLQDAKDKGDLSERFKLAPLVFRGQFLREAIETATNTKSQRVEGRESPLDPTKNVEVADWLNKNKDEIWVPPKPEAPAAKRPEERVREEEPFEIRQARETIAQYEAGALSSKDYGAYRRAKDMVTRYDEQAPAARRFRKGRPWKPVTKEQLALPVGTSWVPPGEQPVKDVLGQDVVRGGKEIPTPAGWQPDPNKPGQFPPSQGAPMQAAKMAASPVVFGTRPARSTSADGKKAKQLRQQASEERYKGNKELADKLEANATAAEAKMTREFTKQVVGLDDFREWIRNNYGHALGETAIVDAWRAAVDADLINATPERIGEFVKAYDLAKKLRIATDPKTGKYVNIPPKQAEYQFELEQEFAAGQKAGSKVLKEERKRALTQEQRRIEIISEIRRRRLAETLPRPDLARTSVSLEDLDFMNKKTVVGVFHKLSDTEVADKNTLRVLLTEKARVSRKEPVAHTKRVGFFVDRETKEGLLLSVFDDNGVLKAVSPAKWGTTERPNVEVDAAFLAKYQPIYSVLLSHPVKNFRQKFANEAAFNDAIGTEAAKIEKPNRYAFAGEDDVPKTASELEMEEKIAAWRELRGEAAREEEGVTVGESGFLEAKPGTRVVRGEGGGFQGPSLMEAKLAEGTVPGEMERAYTQPLTTAEAEQLFDFVHSETAHRKTGGALEGEFPDVGRSRWFLAPEDMVMAFEELVRRAHETNLRAAEVARTAGKPTAAKNLKQILAEPYNPPLSRTDRMVISAMQKIAEKVTARLPESVEPTPALVLSETLKQIYELIKKSEYKTEAGRTGYDVDAFAQRALGRFGEKPEPPVPEAPPSPTAKELALGGEPFRRRAAIPVEGGLTTKGRVYEPTVPESLAQPPYKAPPFPRLVPDVPWPKGYTPPLAEPAPKGVFPQIPVTKGTVGGPKFTGEPPGGVMRGAPKPLPFESMSEAARRAKEIIPEEKVRKGRKKKPEVVPEGQFELGLDMPAAKRRGLQEFQRINEALVAAVGRHSVKSDVRMIQSAETTAANMQAQEAKSAIILASMGQERTYPVLRSLAGQSKAQRLKSEAGSNMRLAASRAVLASADPTGLKERQAAKAEREAALNFAYQHGIQPTPEELAKIPSRPEFIRQHQVPKAQPDFNNLNRLRRFCDIGIEKANRMMRSEDKIERATAERWLDAALKLRKEVEDAQANWNDPALHETARVANREMQDQLHKERAIGMSVREFENYVPGMLEGPIDYYGILSFGGVQGTNFRAPRKFRNAYEAVAAGPYIPAGYNIAEIMGNRIQRGNHIIGRRQWQQAMARTKDPVTGDPLTVDPVPYKYETETYDPLTGEVKLDPDTGKPLKHEETGWMLSSKQHRKYVMLDPVSGREHDGRSGRRPIVIRKGYEDLIKAMTGDSAVRRYKASRALLYATAWFKHNWILMLDSFHLGRLGQYAYAASPGWMKKVFGGSAPGFGADYNGGFSAISYRMEDMQKAADLGLVPQSSVNWAMGRVTLNLGRGKTMEMSRKELLDNVLVPAGLSPRRSADAFYLGQIRKLPGIGRYNKWLFDRFTPGLLAETAIRNFEAYHAKRPDIPYRRLAKDVARDVNIIYAQMEPHSIIKDKTARDITQILLLAPSWREGLIQKELRFMARMPAAGEAGLRKALSALGTGVDPNKNFFLRMTGREGLPPMGALGGMMTRGIMTYFALAQAINQITTWDSEKKRGKFTWENEEGHKLDAKLQFGDQEIWIPTLGVFGELFGDFIRLGETKRNNYERALQIGLNSLGPPGRALNVLINRETPRGQKLVTSGQIGKEMVKQAMSAPISLTEPLRYVAHALIPEWVAPGEKGMLPMRLFGSAGFKVVRGTDKQIQVARMGRDWAKRQGIPEPSVIFTPTQEASLSKLRHAIKIGDEAGARKTWYELIDRYSATPRSEEDRLLSSEDMAVRALGRWVDQPFTGSRVKEELFLASLPVEGRMLYQQAELERMMEYWDIMSLVMTLPPRPPK